MAQPDTLPSDLESAHALIMSLLGRVEDQSSTIDRQAKEITGRDLLIEKLKHQLFGERRHRYGSSAEALDQLQLMLEDLELERSADAPAQDVQAEPKQKPVRKPLPEHLPRNDAVLSPPDTCASCGGKLKQVSQDVTEELDFIPGRFVVNRIVRPRMACTCCEKFHQAPLPSRPIERGRPGSGLLAHVLVSKYGDHLPLYRQSQIYAREGVELERSTLADWVGKSTALLEPLAEAIGRHVRQGEAIFVDDTPVDLLAPGSGKTKTARMWIYGRDGRPWGSDAPPAAFYQFSKDRRGSHPQTHLKDYSGYIHADGYAGFNPLYQKADVHEVACMAHIRRKFVDIVKANGSATATEAVQRIAELYAIEKQIRGKPPDERAQVRQDRAKALLNDLDAWLKSELTKVSAKSTLGKAIRYALTRLPKVRPYLKHGFLELDNNFAERSIRGIAVGRKNYLFMGSEGGGKAAAIAYTLIETCKLKSIEPQAWLTDTLARIADHKITRLDELMPWNYAATAA